MAKFYIFIFIFGITFISCNDQKQKAPTNKATTSKKVKHYICEDNCENSGGDVAGNCQVCNKQLLHNVAYHNDEFMKSGPLQIKSNAAQPNSPVTTNKSTPSPARNASGVYHYTCANGCIGGSGTASNCVACGEALAHNQNYHN